MARSLALGLYLLTRRGRAARVVARPPRPGGPLIWFHAGPGQPLGALAQVARRIDGEAGPFAFLLTAHDGGPPDLSAWPDRTLVAEPPQETDGDVAAFLRHWKPDQLTLFSGELPPALIVGASDARIPMVLVSPGLSRTAVLSWRWRPAMARALLSRFRRIIVPDIDSAERFMSLAGPEVSIVAAGAMEETADALGDLAAEREALGRLLRTRPVWLAVGCPEVEEDLVIAAHQQAVRYAHRTLLVVAPADPARGAALARKLEAADWIVALRSRDDEPDEDVQVVIADTEGELGLWYRLAPVTFLGGSLLGAGPSRSPLEAAILGSAIVTGPQTAPYADIYARLSHARAVRLVRTGASLAEAVSELKAPDRAALLAHNAWVASTGGDEVVERIAEAVVGSLEPVEARPESA